MIGLNLLPLTEEHKQKLIESAKPYLKFQIYFSIKEVTNKEIIVRVL